MRPDTERGARAVLCAVLWTALTSACSDAPPARVQGAEFSVAAKADDDVRFGTVPAFQLISQTGKEVTRETLLGRPYMVAAVFTSCVGPCPRIAREMGGLQKALADTDARLVSISVDPGYDTPEVLAEYAEALGAEEDRWLFLTGPEDEVYDLVRAGFKLGVARADETAPFGMQVTHGTKLVAVDRKGEIRGWYDSQSGDGVALLLERMQFLAAEDE